VVLSCFPARGSGTFHNVLLGLILTILRGRFVRFRIFLRVREVLILNCGGILVPVSRQQWLSSV